MVKRSNGFGWNSDGGLTLFHNWANVSCYPCSGLSGHNASVHRYGSQSCFNVGPASNTIDRD